MRTWEMKTVDEKSGFCECIVKRHCQTESFRQRDSSRLPASLSSSSETSKHSDGINDHSQHDRYHRSHWFLWRRPDSTDSYEMSSTMHEAGRVDNLFGHSLRPDYVTQTIPIHWTITTLINKWICHSIFHCGLIMWIVDCITSPSSL